MKFLILLSVFVVACTAVPSVKEEWASFKAKHGKSYRNENEEHFRLGVYLSNKEMIEEHNARYRAGLESYKLKLNYFSDQLVEEVSRRLNGFNKTGMVEVREHAPVFSRSSLRGRLPASVDWREKGAVTPVKDQGQCGGCWAFSATGALEGQVYLKTGKLVSLSEQNLIDCSTEFNNKGCNGGLMNYAFRYIQENRGIDSEESYPYEGVENGCRFRRSAVAATDDGYVSIEKDEETLMEAVATVGPISVAINAGQRSFLYYDGGVYDDEACSKFRLNHGVLLVGYGSENGRDYWLVKNSWNSDWGEDGYVKIARNQGNLCGIASLASYPRL